MNKEENLIPNIANEIKLKIDIPVEQIHDLQASFSNSLSLVARQIQTLRDSFNSSTISNIRQIAEMNQQSLKIFADEMLLVKKYYDTNYIDGIRQQLEIFNQAKNLFAGTYLTELAKNVAQIKDYFNTNISSIVSIYQQQFRDANKILQSVLPSYVQQFEYIRNNLPSILENISLNKDDSFGYRLVNSVGSLEIDDSESNLENILSTIQRIIIETCKKIKISDSSFNTILSLVLFLLSLIHTHYSSKYSENKIFEKIEISKQQILSQLIEYKPIESENIKAIYYVVIRPTYLFATFSTKSHRNGILFPNTYLKVVVKKKKWLYIEYFDYINGLPKHGWVMKKYCKIVN